MCNPAFAAMGIQAAGSLSQSNAAQQQGAAQSGYYHYLASQNDLQAQRTLDAGNQEVGFIQDQGSYQTKQVRRQAMLTEGAGKAAMAASGVSGSSASAEDVLRSSISNEDLDRAAIRYNADAKSYETQASARNAAIALRGQATAYRYAGDNAVTAGNTNADASLLSGASNVANTWYNWNQTSRGKK